MPGTGRSDSFELVDGVAVYGGFHGDDLQPPNMNGEEALDDRNIFAVNTQVVLSGEIGTPNDISDNSLHVVKVTSQLPGVIAVMRDDGVTVTKGNANIDAFDRNKGGGILADDARLLLVNCTISDNSSGDDECFGNHATGTGGGLAYLAGAGGEDSVSGAAIYDCRFTDNYVKYDYCKGGAVYLDQIDIDIVNCLFARNGADASFCESLGSKGGAIYSVAFDASIVNCTFAGNSVEAAFGDTPGSAVYVGMGAGEPPTTTMTNCVVWANVPAAAALYPAATLLEVDSSDIERGWTGPGGNNIEDDPDFVDGYRLNTSPVSPAIDAGDNDAVPDDALDVDDDTDYFEPAPALEHAGRIQGGVVDPSAYETCDSPYDLDGDQFIGFDELLAVLSDWGPCPGCPPDLDGDGIVGFSDLLIVLSNWGPCGNPGAFAPPQSVLDCMQMYGSQPEKFAKCVEAMMLAGTP